MISEVWENENRKFNCDCKQEIDGWPHITTGGSLVSKIPSQDLPGQVPGLLQGESYDALTENVQIR